MDLIGCTIVVVTKLLRPAYQIVRQCDLDVKMKLMMNFEQYS